MGAGLDAFLASEGYIRPPIADSTKLPTEMEIRETNQGKPEETPHFGPSVNQSKWGQSLWITPYLRSKRPFWSYSHIPPLFQQSQRYYRHGLMDKTLGGLGCAVSFSSESGALSFNGGWLPLILFQF